MNRDNDISIVMPIHNQERIIQKILFGIYKNSSEQIKEIILILDGCTDKTKEKIEEFLKHYNQTRNFDVKIFISEADMWEVKSCNLGFKEAKSPWIINIQDDIEIIEQNFDKRLMKPFEKLDNLIATGGRDSHNVSLINGNIAWTNLCGRDAVNEKDKNRNKFYVRDIVNRAPILFNHKKLQEMNYLDEDFAPICQDDTDLFLRAYKEKGYLCGSYLIDYNSPLEWGGTRKSVEVSNFVHWSEQKNMQLLKERHLNLIIGEKHDFEIEIK